MTTNRYSNGKIYRLVSNIDDEFYVGSTCNPLHKRLYHHKQDARKKNMIVYQHFNTIGMENVSIVLLEEYPCENKMQLEKRERYWIEKLKPKLNKNIPTRSFEEYQKYYREKNKEKLSLLKHEYYHNNKEQISTYQKEYRENHREQLSAKRKEHYENNKEEHRKKQAEYKNKNKEKIKEGQNKYYAENKDAINARRREARVQRKAST